MYEFFLFWRNQRSADDVQENCARKILSPFILSPKNQHRIPLKHQVLFFQLHFHQNKNITIFFSLNISLLAPFFSTSFFFLTFLFTFHLKESFCFINRRCVRVYAVALAQPRKVGRPEQQLQCLTANMKYGWR